MKKGVKSTILLICFVFVNVLIYANQGYNPSDINNTFYNKSESLSPSEKYSPAVENPYTPFGSGLQNEEPPILFAPPEGGDPIGGLPIEDASFVIILATLVYGIISRKKIIKKRMAKN